MQRVTELSIFWAAPRKQCAFPRLGPNQAAKFRHSAVVWQEEKL